MMKIIFRYRRLFFILLLLVAGLGLSTAQDSPSEEFETEEYEGDQIMFRPTDPSWNKPVEPRQISRDIIQKLEADPDYWYADYSPKAKAKKSSDTDAKSGSLLSKTWFKDLIWYFVVFVFLAILIWYLFSSQINLFRRVSKPITNEAEAEVENIFEIDFEKEIRKATEEKDFRRAIRMIYLHTLRLLADANCISYQIDKTNSAYLFQLRGSVFYQPFFRLTRGFEYAWYGHFPVDEQQFSELRQNFLDLKNNIR